MSIRPNTSMPTFSIIYFPSMLILFFFFFFDVGVCFLNVYVIAFFSILKYSSFVIGTCKMIYLQRISCYLTAWSFLSSFSWFCSWFFTFRKSMFFTNSINLDSKVVHSFTGGGILKLHNAHLCWLLFSYLVFWKMAFHLICLITISIFSLVRNFFQMVEGDSLLNFEIWVSPSGI